MAQQPQPRKSSKAKKQGIAKGLLTGSEAEQQQEPTTEERHRMIAEEAYRIAEQRGYKGDHALDDWLQAEATIAARFEEKH